MDTDSTSTMDKDHESTYEELVIAQLELIEQGSTNRNREKLHLVHIVRFREIMGAALGTIPSHQFDWGHSWLASRHNNHLP